MSEIELIILVAFISSSFLSALLIWFVISYQKRKMQYENEKKDAQLREQELIIQNQKAIEYERNRIASEMHDELGSGLTIIQYLSDDILTQSTSPSINENITKIANYSTLLVNNMSEIIWAMNSRFDNLEGLVGYLRRFIVEYLDDNKIEHSFLANNIDNTVIISGEKRRNLYLVVKEILHNTIKHSNATKVVVLINFEDDLTITIREINSLGFDPLLMKNNGNGLFNIEIRLKQIGGSIRYHKTSPDMEMKIVLPMNKENIISSKVS